MSAREPLTPLRPWARDDVPVVWRSDTCVELGWPPRHIRLDGIDRDHISWLLGLGGERELTAALSLGTAAGLSHAAMRRLLRAGVISGLVDDAAAIPESLRDAPLSTRDLLAPEVSAARHLHGATAYAREVIDARRSAEVAIQGDGPVADAVALVLSCSGVGNVVRDRALHSASRRHRRGALDRACHVLCDAAHPDAAADHDAMALDIPHLAVAVTGVRAVIGPLVIPGRTSCLRCRELHLADADPSWPRVAVQWSARKPGPVPAGLAHLAGSWAALQALAVVDTGARDVTLPVMDGALIVGLPDADMVWESRPAHPLCGCQWPATGTGAAHRTAPARRVAG